jgi:hypothetical protein
MSKPTTRSNYTTVVNNRLQKLEIDWAIYDANVDKAEKQKAILHKEIALLVKKYDVRPVDIASVIRRKKQQVNVILGYQKGGDTT